MPKPIMAEFAGRVPESEAWSVVALTAAWTSKRCCKVTVEIRHECGVWVGVRRGREFAYAQECEEYGQEGRLWAGVSDMGRNVCYGQECRAWAGVSVMGSNGITRSVITGRSVCYG